MEKPLILDFSESRIDDAKPLYSYDEKLNLNVIKINDSAKPFVESDIRDMELETKTKVRNESEDVDTMPFMEMTTKTFVEREQDDEGNTKNSFLVLLTKTHVASESDD